MGIRSGTFTKRLLLHCVHIEFEFRNVGFLREGKTGVPGEKPLGARTRTNNKLNPHLTPGPGVKARLHWWEESAHTTAPSLLPLFMRPCYIYVPIHHHFRSQTGE